jgi:Zn ribbon nucleic-acid-binding protein
MKKIDLENNYNRCPSCGRQAHAFLTEDNLYRVGCLHCGLRHGVSTYVDEVTEEVREQMRHAWNQHCLSTPITDSALERLDLLGTGYALVRVNDNYIAHFFTEFSKLTEFCKSRDSDNAYNVYLMIDGTLQCLGSAYLLWLAKNNP